MRAKNRHCFTHIFFHPDCNRWSRSFTGLADTKTVSGRGLYRQWGIAPRPEDIRFLVVMSTLYAICKWIATPIFWERDVRVLKKFKIPLYAKEEKYIKMNLS